MRHSPFSACSIARGEVVLTGQPREAGSQKGRYPRLVDWLRQMHARGAVLCSACSGIFLLAETGLFDGKDATVHFSYAQQFTAAYPAVAIHPERVLVIAGLREDLVSSDASTTWHDMVLYLIARYAGATDAEEGARMYALQWHQDGLAPYITFEGKSDRAADDGAPADPVLGKTKFYTCYGCHGVEGYRNAYPNYRVPKLRHQHATYIIAALRQYKSGERPHPTMHAQAASLSDQDMADIAAYLQDVPVNPAAGAAAPAPKQLSACTACHGENGLGVEAPLNPKPPVLAGQHADYLEQALTSYRNGHRKNIPMNGMAQLLTSDEDIKVVAAYFASQPSPLTTATNSSKVSCPGASVVRFSAK